MIPNKPILSIILTLALFISACSAEGGNADITATPEFLTATLAPSSTAEATQTPLPPSPVATLPPIEGTTTTQVNVRAEPSTNSTVMGIIPAAMNVLIQGRDASGTWYQLVFAEGKGWVSAEYVQVNAGVEVPVIYVGTGTGSSASVLVVQRVNVRTGPGTQFETVGNLSPNDAVALTGKDSSSAWLQIEHASAPDGRGWINAEFVEASGLEGVPVVAETSQATGTEAANGESTAIPPLAVAPEDADSPNAPSITVAFTPAGMRALQFSSTVSAPQGDREDWVQFTPYGPGPHIQIDLTCSGSNASLLELTTAQAVIVLACGERKSVEVQAGETYLVHIAAVEGEPGLTAYTLKIEQLP